MNGVLLRPSRVEYKREHEDAYNSRSTGTIHVCAWPFIPRPIREFKFILGGKSTAMGSQCSAFARGLAGSTLWPLYARSAPENNHQKAAHRAYDIVQVAVMPLHGDMINGCHV